MDVYHILLSGVRCLMCWLGSMRVCASACISIPQVMSLEELKHLYVLYKLRVLNLLHNPVEVQCVCVCVCVCECECECVCVCECV